MTTAPAIVYVTPDKAMFFTIPKWRHLNSYSAEVLTLLGYTLHESHEVDDVSFEEDDYILQMNLRVYVSANKKSEVLVRYTVKPNDFSAIPQAIQERLGPLTELSVTSKTDYLTVIREIITKGYLIRTAR
ncbi:hypothetical protein WBJ53_04755 [Spirosoma sp. SC4-14]|uniref:hypothetical protein n=1 Tax=Spirosoma sp. SC4-14 TaxID=3128900 RepID=UPI0030D11581